MYLPPAFREDRPDVLFALIRSHPLGTLVTAGTEGPEVNLLPFVLTLEPGPVLRAHLARANPQLAALRVGAPSLVVFHGPQTYITPAWYATKAETGKVVPTWNYAVAQVRGRPIVHDDAEWLRAHVTHLTDTHEQQRPEPWAVNDAPPAFVDGQLKGIVGLEIPIEELVGKWKMSQNRNPADRATVVQGLQAEGRPDLADWIR